MKKVWNFYILDINFFRDKSTPNMIHDYTPFSHMQTIGIKQWHENSKEENIKSYGSRYYHGFFLKTNSTVF